MREWSRVHCRSKQVISRWRQTTIDTSVRTWWVDSETPVARVADSVGVSTMDPRGTDGRQVRLSPASRSPSVVVVVRPPQSGIRMMMTRSLQRSGLHRDYGSSVQPIIAAAPPMSYCTPRNTSQEIAMLLLLPERYFLTTGRGCNVHFMSSSLLSH